MQLNFRAIREGSTGELVDREEKAGQLITQYKQEQVERERNLAVYKEYQHNIKESGSLRAAILKGVKDGESVITLFLKAAKCISLMTGSKLFYEQIEADVANIYGLGTKEPILLKKEMEELHKKIE